MTDLATTAEIVAHNSSSRADVQRSGVGRPDSQVHWRSPEHHRRGDLPRKRVRSFCNLIGVPVRPVASTSRLGDATDIASALTIFSSFTPSLLAGEPVGTVYIDSDLSEVQARVRRYLRRHDSGHDGRRGRRLDAGPNPARGDRQARHCSSKRRFAPSPPSRTMRCEPRRRATTSSGGSSTASTRC